MAAPTIGRRPRWAPGISAYFDSTHPTASSLLALWRPGGADFVNLMNRGDDLVWSGGAGIVQTASAFGTTLGMDTTSAATTSSSWLDSAPSAGLQPSTAVTLLWCGVIYGSGSATGSRRLIGMHPDNANGTPFISWGLYRSSATAITAGCGTSAGFASTSAFTPTVGSNVIALTYDGANIIAYLNGSRVASVAQTGTLSYTGTANVTINGYGGASATNGINAGMTLGAVWGRALTGNEIAAVSAHPFSLLRY